MLLDRDLMVLETNASLKDLIRDGQLFKADERTDGLNPSHTSMTEDENLDDIFYSAEIL